MENQADPPLRLFHQLAQGEIDDEDLDLLCAMLRAEGLAECPPDMRAWARRLPQSQQPAAAGGKEIVERVVRLARLVFDSWSTPQLAPVRSYGSQSRQLLLRAQDVEISLHMQSAGRDHMTIIGQILGASNSLGEVSLIRPTIAPGKEASLDPDHGCLVKPAYGPVPVDSLGEFVIDQIRPGRYVLSVQLDVQRVDSEALELGDKPVDLAH